MTIDVRLAYAMFIPLARTADQTVVPAARSIQPYDARGGAMNVSLPSIATVGEGYSMMVEKDASVDYTPNGVAYNCASGDSFVNGTVTRTINVPGERLWLQSALLGTSKVWKMIHHHRPTIEKYRFTSTASPLATAVGNFRAYIEFPSAFYIGRASVVSAPGGQAIITDFAKNGTSIFPSDASRPTIAPSTFTDTGYPPGAVVTFDTGDYLTANITQVGSPGTEGATLELYAYLRQL